MRAGIAVRAGLFEPPVEIGPDLGDQRSTQFSKKWLASGMTACSIRMPFCVFSFSIRVCTSLSGATRSLSPWTNRPGGGAGRQEGEVVERRRRRDRDEALDLRAPHQKLHADPGAEREAGDPAGPRLGADGLRPIERRGGVRQFARAVIEVALRAADAAEVEAQHREAALGEGVVEAVDDLVVHRPAELRMRMQHDRDRRAALLGGVKPALEAAGRSGEDDFRHEISEFRAFAVSEAHQ